MTTARAMLPGLVGANVGNVLAAIVFASMNKAVSPWTLTWWAVCVGLLVTDWIVVCRQR